MMDCKSSLKQRDMDAAVEFRKNGQAKAEKAGRIAAEGIVKQL